MLCLRRCRRRRLCCSAEVDGLVVVPEEFLELVALQDAYERADAAGAEFHPIARLRHWELLCRFVVIGTRRAFPKVAPWTAAELAEEHVRGERDEGEQGDDG